MSPSASSSNSSSATPWLHAFGSRFFIDWLAEQHVSVAFTTYQTGKLFFVGRKPNQSLALFERTYGHCMGLWGTTDAKTLWLASRFQLWRLELTRAEAVPCPHADETGSATGGSNWGARGYDFAYVPVAGYTTGHVDVHDLAVDRQERVLFVNTLFSCVATLSRRASFQPLWRPAFVSALVPEDRCHLNGLAMRDGRAAFVTAVADSDVADGWRDRRRDGGCIIDVASNEIIASGLSMPHSPRWHRDRLWLLNSGTGEFGWVDVDTGRFEPVAFCPGYLRGLSFVGDFAVVTLSRPRDQSFRGLNLDERLAQRNAEPQCGLQVIDLRSGSVSHWLRLEGERITELYDVVVLPGMRQPMAIGFQTNEIERFVVVDEEGEL